MKKLLAAATIAASLTAFAPGASPAGAVDGHPSAGDTVLCSVSFRSAKIYTAGGSIIGNNSYIAGTCTSLSTLERFPVTTPNYSGGGGGYECMATAPLNIYIGTGRYFATWPTPTVATVNLPLIGPSLGGPLPVVAAGPLVAAGPYVPANTGFATFIGTADCSVPAGHVEGSMVFTLTVAEPYTGG